MTALVVTTENEIRKVPYDAPHYEVIQEAVGGHYELVRPRGLQEPYCMMVNEEGRLLGLPLNLLGCYLYGTLIHGAPIAGDIMILRRRDSTVGRPVHAAEFRCGSLGKR